MPNFALAHGKPTSSVEVTNVSAHGLWLFAHNGEFFISYDDSPWFREQTISSIINVEEQAPGHYYWPDIDVDLSQEIIEHPERSLPAREARSARRVVRGRRRRERLAEVAKGP